MSGFSLSENGFSRIVSSPSAITIVCPLTSPRYVLYLLGEQRSQHCRGELLLIRNKAGLAVFCGIIVTVMYKHGGVHQWDLTSMQVHTISYVRTDMFGLKGFRNADLPVEWFNVGTVTYGLTIMCTKLAILLLYRRVFLPQRWSVFDVAIRLLMLIICLFYIATTAVKIWECTPRSRIWDKSIQGTCINVSSLLNTSGLFNTISDILILLVPVKSVWRLNMDRGRKVACVLLFTVGLM